MNKNLFILVLISYRLAAQDIQLPASKLNAPVEIIIDTWGVPHIYAKNEHDLFFAQGFQAAKDRLFQLEMFRRQANGTMAEVLGESEMNRDLGARLFKFRGNMDTEMAHYHPRGKRIITSFVEGINAYIDLVRARPDLLPLELKLLDIMPQYWTPEIVISRHNALLSNITEEYAIAKDVIQYGEAFVKAVNHFEPHIPDLKLDPSINPMWIQQANPLNVYNAFRNPINFKKEQIDFTDVPVGENLMNSGYRDESGFISKEGSNNWVISGTKTSSKYPILANDPHRAIKVPSLRYIVHLQAPGWNVIGGGEPSLPGVSIGHNEYGAWGLTIFSTDMEDMYLYKLNPLNLNQYNYKGHWISFRTVRDSIKIKNRPTQYVLHRFSVHGPVTMIDSLHHVAYAIKCAWLQTGCAPYLASLRMDQSKTWTEFRNACSYSFLPAENMVWADKKGNIGWQAVGIAPIRKKHSGMVPIPGDGRYEWSGFLPVLQRPHRYNPANGFIATANENLTSSDYPYLSSLGFHWTDSYRGDRIRSILFRHDSFTIEDNKTLQSDWYSIPASEIIPLFNKQTYPDTSVNNAITILRNWDYYLNPDSKAAPIYIALEETLKAKAIKTLSHDESINPSTPISTVSLIAWIKGLHNRDSLLTEALTHSIHNLEKIMGSDLNTWKYGAPEFKHVAISHPLMKATENKFPAFETIGPAARGGDDNTVNATGETKNQTAGASFRIIVDCADWDLAVSINTPGQSGIPGNKHYQDLFKLWTKNQYFPLYYSKDKIMMNVDEKYKLTR